MICVLAARSVTSPGSRLTSMAPSPGPAKATTDTAIIMGLAGNLPENVDIDGIPEFISRVEQTGRLPIGLHLATPSASPKAPWCFQRRGPALHENGMKLTAFIEDEAVLQQDLLLHRRWLHRRRRSFGRSRQRRHDRQLPFKERRRVVSPTAARPVFPSPP